MNSIKINRGDYTYNMTTKEKLQYVESYYEKMGNLYLADPEHIQDFHIVMHYLHLLLQEEVK